MQKLTHNYIILFSTALIAFLGIVTLVSTEISLNGDINWGGVVQKQLIFFLIGSIIYLIISRFDYTYLRYPIILLVAYVGILLLLLATILFAPVINGVQRWLVIGGFQLQVSEFAKILMILITAGAFSFRERYNEWILAIVSGAMMIPLLVLIYIEPHGSMSFLIFGIWAITVFVSLSNILRNSLLAIIFSSIVVGILALNFGSWLLGVIALLVGFSLFFMTIYSGDRAKHLFIAALVIALVSGAVLSIGWQGILKDYQKERITSFFQRKEDDTECENCFNVDQSLIAIGSGGVWGKGFGYGTQSRLQFLPEHQTDFIYASYAEQFGLVGSIFLITLYGAIIMTTFTFAMKYSTDPFASTLLVGLGIKLLLELFVNMGTNLALIPATGSPLPLMSAGGSITIATFFSIGLIQSIIAHHIKGPKVKDFVDKDELLI